MPDFEIKFAKDRPQLTGWQALFHWNHPKLKAALNDLFLADSDRMKFEISRVTVTEEGITATFNARSTKETTDAKSGLSKSV